MGDESIQHMQSSTDSMLGNLLESRRNRGIATAVLVVIALLFCLVIAPFAASPDTHADTIASLDEKRNTTLALVASSTAASAAISVLPDDTGTPIADKLADLSSDFLIVITAILLEKYLLSVLGWAAFGILIPLACVLLIIAVWLYRRRDSQRTLMAWAVRVAIFGIAVFALIPTSVMVSDMIESTYETSINSTIEAAEQSGQLAQENTDTSQQEEGIGGIISDVTNGVTSAIQNAQNILNDFIEALAIMIVTTCIIPILVLLFFLWLMQMILGITVNVPSRLTHPRIAGR